MPYSLLINCYPTAEIPVAHVQGSMMQAMFLHLMQQVDQDLAVRLHDESGYRPFTLSPLGIYREVSRFQGFWLPPEQRFPQETACYFRLTFLDDALFADFDRFFQEHPEPRFTLGDVEFVITDILSTLDSENVWSGYQSYPELIDRALRQPQNRKLRLRFLTPTSFSQGRIDLPLPLPRLVFQSYKKRFEKFYQVTFLPDFEEQVQYHVGISWMKHIKTAVIQTKNVRLIGFTGDVLFMIHPKAPSELLFQLNLLAEFAFYCGTGKKTTMGMGQTMRL